MIAWATQSVAISASVTRRRAFPGLLRQEIVGRAINGSAESVDIGVHRGLLVNGDLITADFGLSASNPLPTGIPVESII
jgi:hypothetical protein